MPSDRAYCGRCSTHHHFGFDEVGAPVEMAACYRAREPTPKPLAIRNDEITPDDLDRLAAMAERPEPMVVMRSKVDPPMMPEPKTLREATKDLYDSFGIATGPGIHPYIQAIGVSASHDGEHIQVYLARNPRSHERSIPAEWMGYPVKSTISGRFVVRG